MTEPVFQKLNILNLIFLLVGYIILHLIIAVQHKKYGQLKEEKPGNQEIEKTHKYLTIANKWFAFAYLIFVLLVLR